MLKFILFLLFYRDWRIYSSKSWR